MALWIAAYLYLNHRCMEHYILCCIMMPEPEALG